MASPYAKTSWMAYSYIYPKSKDIFFHVFSSTHFLLLHILIFFLRLRSFLLLFLCDPLYYLPVGM
jgi:hypothetical protein